MQTMKSGEDKTNKAKKALNKPPAFGSDVNIENFYKNIPEAKTGLTNLSEEEKKQMLLAGVDTSGAERSGTFIQKDHCVVHSGATQPGLEVMSIGEARKQHEWLNEYWWNAVPVDLDKFTAHVELKNTEGYFLRTAPGHKTFFPLQSCLYMDTESGYQNVHNVIIAEEASEMHIITGCTTAPSVHEGLHLGVSEFYVKKNARITFTMIHNWGEDVIVRPRTVTIVDEGGVFISNYISMHTAKDLQMYPTIRLAGRNAIARSNTIVVAKEGSNYDIGAKIILEKPGCKAEIISRTISTGGNIIVRGALVGKSPEIKAHLECRGLVLNENGLVHAIPELEGHGKGLDMSHEAAVGKIAREEIEYLMARGLQECEAISTIVRGFLNVQLIGLPPLLKQEIDKAIEIGEKDMY